MYKSKLQELCHKRRWGLPKYSTMKEGPDHNPFFTSSVSVNGLCFHSSVPSNSFKQAHNHAAMLAFLHFTSPSQPTTTTGPSTSTVASEPKTQDELDSHSHTPVLKNVSGTELNIGERNANESYELGSDIQSHGLGVEGDAACRYKSRLQTYARWKKCNLPSYSSEREGPPHASRFKAKVAVDGHTFESAEFFMTLKEAEQAAAKAALMSLPKHGFHENDYGAYKNLLQELVQREDLCMPVYKTVKSGTLHMPIFCSSVEVEGEKFYGEAGKSKKEAQMKAAKVAYTALKERASRKSAGDKSMPSPVIILEELLPESKDEVNVTETEMVLQIGTEEDSIAVAEASDTGKAIGNQASSNSSCGTNHDNSLPSNSDSDAHKALEPKSYLLCNRFRVYSYYPDIAFPEGITVLPIGEKQWVAVSLELSK